MTKITLDNCPAILTVPEMAQVLRIGRNKAYQLVRDGDIPSIKLGRDIRIYREDLLRYVSA